MTGKPDKQQSSDMKWLAWSLGALLAVMLVIIGVLWKVGLFDYTGTDASAKIGVAIIALVGTFFGTTVTLVGLMLKRSFDASSLALQREAEERDSAIKTVELFKSASGSASPAESAGALFALVRLGQPDFALHLLQELWPKGRIEAPSAVWVINSCLHSTKPGVAEMATSLLEGNSERLLDRKGSHSWPVDFEYECPGQMPFLARHALLAARIKSLLSADFEYWKKDTLNGVIVALSKAFRKDPSPIIRQSAAAFSVILLRTYDPQMKYCMLLPAGTLSVEELRAEVELEFDSSVFAGTTQHDELAQKLAAWIKRAPYFEDKKDTR